MIIIEKLVQIENQDLIPDNSMFFDIETTGFSGKSSRIYLIGTLSKEEQGFVFRQFMTESYSDEINVLYEFINLASNFNILITFNGETFDFRFIKERLDKYKIDFDFNNFESLDILKVIKSKSYLMDFENHKLKTLEKNIGIFREDMFSGGELIEIYKIFESTKDEKLKQTLLLHNEEDILNMPNMFKLIEKIRQKNTISLDDYYFEIENISLTKSKLKITGISNLKNGYFENNLNKINIDNNYFIFESVVEIGNYDDNTKCIYTHKGEYNLSCNYNIPSPDSIYIVKHHKNTLYKNIYSLFLEFVKGELN